MPWCLAQLLLDRGDADAATTLLERIKKPNDKPEQREEAKEPVTLLADAAQTKPVFEVVAEHLATLGSGTRLEMQRVGDKDRHGHETSGLKKLQRVVETVTCRAPALRALLSLLSHSELTVLEGSSGSDDGPVVSVVPEVI